MHTDEVLWHEVMERLAEIAITFIDVQLQHGARAFQLFDSWAGSLSVADYDRFVLPHSERVFAELATAIPTSPASTSASAATTCSSGCTRPARA